MTDSPKPGTPLPWYAEGECVFGQGRSFACETFDEILIYEVQKMNTAYIVHACNSLPALLAERDGLKKRLHEDNVDRIRAENKVEALSARVKVLEGVVEGLLAWVDAPQLQRNFMGAKVAAARQALQERS